MQIKIQRYELRSNYILSRVTVKDQLFYGLELGWNNNKKRVSAIPTGVYNAFWKTKERLQFINVPDRTNIQIHIGNYINQTEGCILLGKSIVQSENKGDIPYVIESTKAVNELYELTKGDNIIIKVTDTPELSQWLAAILIYITFKI